VSSRQRQRHYPVGEMCELVAASGLELLAVYGQRPGAVLDDEADEGRHTKAVFLARREVIA
jgi:hypothetical protein